jgi:D-beta-D-heptose 7-phosphate kinase/D-beta-D-heptose 1-phosphate adenosyltransferase
MTSEDRAREIMGAFAGKRVLVVGDLMLDRYVSGTVRRISPEAPVPIVRVTDERSLPGGAANVALNIKSLGGDVTVAGIVGQDASGDDLMQLLSGEGISTDGVIRSGEACTTVKTRVLADRQQVVRVDREDGPPAAADPGEELAARAAELVPGVSGVVIEDYGKGAVSQRVVDAVLAAAKAAGKPVGLDPRDNHELRLSGITLATPNYKEALACAALPESSPSDDPETDKHLAKAAGILAEKWGTELLIVTLGRHGMYLLPKGAPAEVIPARAREVFDVTGAGDTVIATALLSLVAGASHRDAASLANTAAGVVVGKLGAATCTPDELVAYMDWGHEP